MPLTNEWKAKREAALKVGVNREKGSRSLKVIYNVLLKLDIEYIGVHFISLFKIEQIIQNSTRNKELKLKNTLSITAFIYFSIYDIGNNEKGGKGRWR